MNTKALEIQQAAAQALGVEPGDVEEVWSNPGIIYHDRSQDFTYGFTVGGVKWDEAAPERRVVVAHYHDGTIRA